MKTKVTITAEIEPEEIKVLYKIIGHLSPAEMQTKYGITTPEMPLMNGWFELNTLVENLEDDDDA